MGGQAPTTADFSEPSRDEVEGEADAAALLQQLILRGQSHWKEERAALRAAIEGAKEFASLRSERRRHTAIAVARRECAKDAKTQERGAAEPARAAAQKRTDAVGNKRRRQPIGEEQGDRERGRRRPSTNTCLSLGELYQKYVIAPQTADASSTTAEQGAPKESRMDTSKRPRTSGGTSGRPGAAAGTVAASVEATPVCATERLAAFVHACGADGAKKLHGEGVQLEWKTRKAGLGTWPYGCGRTRAHVVLLCLHEARS